MSMTKQEACDFLADLAERLRRIPVKYGTDEGDIDQLQDIEKLITSDFGVDNERVEEALRNVKSNGYDFRAFLTDRAELLARVCDYADILADRRRTEPWVIMQEIFGQGAGVSSAIFHAYRRES